MLIQDAPAAISASIHALVSGHMAAALLLHRIDLRDHTACRVALIQHGFGETSVAALLPASIEAAARHLVAEGGQ